MKYLVTVALVIVLGSIALAAQAAGQEREEIMVVIPLQYMSADLAAQIFGGWVIPPTVRSYGSGPGYGSYTGGSRIGGGRGYSGYGGRAYGNRGASNRSYGGQSYGNYGAYGGGFGGNVNPEYQF